MEDNKCRFCGGELVLSKSRTKKICPFCDAKFDVDAKSLGDPDGRDAGLNQELFYIDRDFREAMKKKNTSESIGAIRYCLNELGTAKDVENYIRNSLINDEDVASEGVNQRRIENVKDKIEPHMEAGERIIVYGDNDLFFRGKNFVLVTNLKCMFFTKKGVKIVRHKDLISIKLDDSLSTPSWLLNGNYETTISNFGAKYQLQGAIIALISLLIFENNQDRERIRLV